MEFFRKYIKEKAVYIAVFLLFCLVFLCAFLLYHLPAGAVLYPTLICTVFAAVFLFFDYNKAYKKHKELKLLQNLSSDLMEHFPEAVTNDDEDYQRIIRLLREEKMHRDNEMNVKYSNMINYYTMWAHQIKTPIASMSLTLQNEDTETARTVSEDLFRIEQYVEMVLMFLRLDSDTNDYVIKEYDLDKIVKTAVKKFANQFIRRKISLDYNELNYSVLTDEKWLSFVIEQVLSNALKYTPSGKISIYLENQETLCVKDSGIGIAPEDLPRIFEKGYTGYNGRADKRASGIGLYLCRRICDNLGHTITAESSVNEGTAIRIGLGRQKIEFE